MGLVNIEHLPAQWGRFNKNLHLNNIIFFYVVTLSQKPELLVFPPPESRTSVRKEIDPNSHHEVVLKLTEVLIDEERKRRPSIHVEVGSRKCKLGPNAESGMPNL